LYKNGKSTKSESIGFDLREMLYAMRHRGIDSTGVTIAGQRFRADYVFRLVISEKGVDVESVIDAIGKRVSESGAAVKFVNDFGRFFRLGLTIKETCANFRTRSCQWKEQRFIAQEDLRR